MPYSEKNGAILDKYEELVKKHYTHSQKTASSKIGIPVISEFEVGIAREEFNIGWYKIN